MASETDITIKVKVDANGAITLLDKTGQEIKKVDSAAEQAGRSFSVFGSILQGIAQGVGQELFRTLTQLPGAIVDLASKGSEIDDMSEAFTRLSEQAGTTAEVFLNELQEATAGTISDFELMKRSNEALNAGLKPDALVTVAEAARNLGETFGGDLQQNFNEILNSLQKGDDRFLKARGILIDNDKAYQEFAKTIGTTADKLSELGKAQAVQEAVLKALEEQNKKTGKAQLDTGDAINIVKTAIENFRNKVAEAIGTNESLKNVILRLGEAIKNVDVETLANHISTILTTAIDFATEAIKQFTEELDNLQRGYLVLKTGSFEVAAQLHEQNKENQALAKGNETLGKTLDSLGGVFKKATDIQDKFIAGIEVTRADLVPLEKELKKLTETKLNDIQKQGAYNQGIEKTQLLLKNLKILLPEVVEQERRKTDQLIKGAKGTADNSKETKTLVELNQEFSGKIRQVIEQFQDGIITQDQAKRSLDDLERVYVKLGGSAAQFGKVEGVIFEKKIQDINSELDKGKEKVLTFADTISNTLNGALSNIGDQVIAGDFSGAFSDVARALGDELGREMGKQLGTALGGIVGSIGGPVGTALGSILGSFLGDRASKDFDLALKGKFRNLGKDLLTLSTFGQSDLLDKVLGGRLFGGNSKGTEAKKSADRYFADLFDHNRLQVIIDGELRQIKDLVFSGNQTGGLFATLPAQVQAAFQGVGAGFEGLLGVASDLGVNIGNVLANNVGGSLNNLQLLVKATGVSFEELEAQVISSFERGELSIGEANAALAGIQQIAADGIPGALGAVDEAFKNLEAAGKKGGLALVDALQDIGFEAKELGIKDFPGIIAELKKRLPEASGDIDKLFEALKASGIDSIEELTESTTKDLLPALGKLEDVEFPFAEAIEEAQGLIDQLDKLPSEINSRINLDVRTNFDDNTNKLVNQGADLSSLKVGSSPGIQ